MDFFIYYASLKWNIFSVLANVPFQEIRLCSRLSRNPSQQRKTVSQAGSKTCQLVPLCSSKPLCLPTSCSLSQPPPPPFLSQQLRCPWPQLGLIFPRLAHGVNTGLSLILCYTLGPVGNHCSSSGASQVENSARELKERGGGWQDTNETLSLLWRVCTQTVSHTLHASLKKRAMQIF